VTKWLLAALGLVVLYQVRGVLGPFVVAGILAYILVPAVEALAQRFRVKRVVVVTLIFLLLLACLGVGAWALEPTLFRETRDLVQNTPAILDSLFVQTMGSEKVEILGTSVDAQTMARELLSAIRDSLGRPTEALHIAEEAIRAVFDAFLVLIVLFYLLLDWQRLIAFGFRFVPAESRGRVGEIAARIHGVLGRYIRGQISLILLMGGVTWIVLSWGFHLRFATPIALATGFLEIIPLVGPVIAAAIAATVGFTQGGVQMVIALVVFYTVARQVEDQIVMPLVVGRAVHLHPVATVFAALCGGVLAGVLGMILAVPTMAALAVILDEVWPADK
jgi:predicted PurR-regulated permease PerM